MSTFWTKAQCCESDIRNTYSPLSKFSVIFLWQPLIHILADYELYLDYKIQKLFRLELFLKNSLEFVISVKEVPSCKSIQVTTLFEFVTKAVVEHILRNFIILELTAWFDTDATAFFSFSKHQIPISFLYLYFSDHN